MSYKVLRGYKHTQTSPSNVWTITHNLGESYPIIDVFYNDSGTMTKILPEEVTVINQNTIQLTFSSSISGEAEVT